jgi:predicted RNase H-like nuclease (RuvC/YqgF family)
VIENKNLEIMSLKQTYENKLMTVEDFLSQERARHDRNEFENKNQVSTQSQNINLLETRLKDLGKLLNSYDVEIKNLKREKENLKKQIEEFKKDPFLAGFYRSSYSNYGASAGSSTSNSTYHKIGIDVREEMNYDLGNFE